MKIARTGKSPKSLEKLNKQVGERSKREREARGRQKQEGERSKRETETSGREKQVGESRTSIRYNVIHMHILGT